MHAFDRIKDLLAIVIAAIAVMLSLVAVLVQRRQQQRDAYRQIHDVLMSVDLQRGRWAIIQISLHEMPVPSEFSAEFYLLNRTLGVYDTLAMYAHHHVIPEKWVLDTWHHPLAAMKAGAEQLARRHQEIGFRWVPWPYLWDLLVKAENYRSSLACCTLSTSYTDSSRAG